MVEHLGRPDDALIADDTSAIKKGDKSAGVARQYCGLTGQVENCQVMPMLTYASAVGHAFINRRLYLPESWANDPGRRKEAGIPDEVVFATKPAPGHRHARRGDHRRHSVPLPVRRLILSDIA